MSTESDPLAWARDYTPVLQSLGDEHEETEPLACYTIAVATHMEAVSGCLVEALNRAGAEAVQFCSTGSLLPDSDTASVRSSA